jgi:uncharacterized protein
MKMSMYQVSVPVFVHMLENLREFLKKGEVYAEQKMFSPEVLINSRLAPDMLPLSRQIQIATDLARRCVARLAGIEAPVFEDDEKSFTELYVRIDKTIEFLKSIKPEQVDGTEEKPISFEVRGHTLNFHGMGMLLNFSFPNIYFHITTAYNILRHNGVGLGKIDFLGDPTI